MGELDEAEGVLTLVEIAIAHIAAEIAAEASEDEMPRIEATVLHTAIALARQRVRIGDYPRREILVVETAAGEIAEPKIAFEEHPVAVIESRESFCRLSGDRLISQTRIDLGGHAAVIQVLLLAARAHPVACAGLEGPPSRQRRRLQHNRRLDPHR